MKGNQSGIADGDSRQVDWRVRQLGVDVNEAPKGFYAEPKVWRDYNVCRDCDARKLCQENKDNWCLENRCMSYEIVAFKDGKTYSRKDGQSVIFKRMGNANAQSA